MRNSQELKTDAGLYLRLSRDEDMGRESSSITNQRNILRDYAERNGLTVVEEYADDGYSGLLYDHPAFQRMLKDIQQGRINAVIVKDLSRLGRDYITNGNYIENIFPRMGVRFICVNESYDSQLDPEMEDFLPYLNIANQLHAKQSGKKSQQARMAMARRGEYIGGRAPYGYVLDSEDKHHLVVEPETAEVVKKIFRYACDGLGYKAIARRLDEAGIKNPTAHTGDNAAGRRDSDWNPSTVKDILTKEVYLGKTVSGKRRKLLLKSPEITRMPEKDWLVVEGTHEAIIDQQTWDTAQEKLAVRKRSDNQGAIQIFAGLVKCADCGYALAYSGNATPRFQCSRYSAKGKAYCSSHYISYDDLYAVVLSDIRRRAKGALKMKEHLLLRLHNEASGLLDKRAKEVQREYKKVTDRVDELERIIARLFEDGALGKVSEARCRSLMERYEQEQSELLERRRLMCAELEEQKQRRSEQEAFLDALSRYDQLEGLSARILNELIREIRVGVKYTEDGVKKQRIKIEYKQDCYVELFDEEPGTADLDEENPEWGLSQNAIALLKNTAKKSEGRFPW